MKLSQLVLMLQWSLLHRKRRIGRAPAVKECGWPRTMRSRRRERSSDERCRSNDTARREEKLGNRSSKRLTGAVMVKELSRVATPGWTGLCDTAAARPGLAGSRMSDCRRVGDEADRGVVDVIRTQCSAGVVSVDVQRGEESNESFSRSLPAGTCTAWAFLQQPKLMPAETQLSTRARATVDQAVVAPVGMEVTGRK